MISQSLYYTMVIKHTVVSFCAISILILHFCERFYCRFTSGLNEGISAASLWDQVAALVPDQFCNFYLVKNHKIAYNSATNEAIEKITMYLESLVFYNFFDVCLTKLKNYQILLNKISHGFLVTTKLFSGLKEPHWGLVCYWYLLSSQSNVLASWWHFRFLI